MTVQNIEIAEPFFTTRYITDEQQYAVKGHSIVLNLCESPIIIEDQNLGALQSVVVCNTSIKKVHRAVIIERFSIHKDEALLFQEVRKHWPLAFDIRKEARLKGVEHYLSPKVSIENIRFSMYHSASVPLNVGLHREHPFCEEPGFKEVHTQVVGFGKMQQCREKDIDTLYMEEIMAPGHTHRPMYDENGNYPWHQYETITPSIFMAVEMLPEA